MKIATCSALLMTCLAGTANVSAAVFGGVDFPDGALSFADEVIDYSPLGGPLSAAASVPEEALGTPDYPSGPGTDYVSLGDGGSITLRFTDNSLTGSETTAFDLWIFEIGPDVEDTFVEISKNGIDWFDVGKVTGSTSGIDIDAYGFGTSDFFSFVRLTDDTNEGQQSGSTVGADIDAVGAITSAPPAPVPLPAAIWLLGPALLGLGAMRRS